MKTNGLIEKLIELFGHVRVTVNGRYALCCPVCNQQGRLSVDPNLDSVRCWACGFRACPIALFIDAYSSEPTGDLLESDCSSVTKDGANDDAVSAPSFYVAEMMPQAKKFVNVEVKRRTRSKPFSL